MSSTPVTGGGGGTSTGTSTSSTTGPAAQKTRIPSENKSPFTGWQPLDIPAEKKPFYNPERIKRQEKIATQPRLYNGPIQPNTKPTTTEELERREQFRQDLLDAFVDIVPLATEIAAAGGFTPARSIGRISKSATAYGRKYYGRVVKRH